MPSRPQNDSVTPDPHEPLRLIVDSEVFEIAEAAGQPGGCHHTWTSGPNPDYGFTSVPSDGHQLSVGEHEAANREILTSINPETGYLD